MESFLYPDPTIPCPLVWLILCYFPLQSNFFACFYEMMARLFVSCQTNLDRERNCSKKV